MLWKLRVKETEPLTSLRVVYVAAWWMTSRVVNDMKWSKWFEINYQRR